jgi:hypothetical protein
MHRRQFIQICPASAVGFVTAVEGWAATPPKTALSSKYETLRARFLRDFEHDGLSALLANGNKRKFGDQTLHMGFALVTFAGEARVLRQAGQNPKRSEEVVRRLLSAFDRLDRDAESERYQTSVPGFFLRDDGPMWKPFDVESDFRSDNLQMADMSVDQVVSLMMGWWAVAHWSTDDANRRLARDQADRVMDYLCAQRFWIEQPKTHTAVKRGDDARALAGFLCHMGEQITGEDYYHRGKVRLSHDNKCHTCGGTGEVNAADPNLQCFTCNGTGHCKVVVGGGRCEVCRGTGETKIITETKCPGCGGSGEIELTAKNPITGKKVTIGKGKCGLCHGSGKIGGETSLGKCKVCGGSGRLPQYTNDLGKCKICGGSGRLKGTLPKIKCPICGGSKELNLYVSVTHPIILALAPLGIAASLAAPVHKISVDKKDKTKITIEPGKIGPSYSRHMAAVCLAFEDAVPDPGLLVAAKDSNHPWSVALRAARAATICPACHGNGKQFVMIPALVGAGPLHPLEVSARRQDLGACKVCNGTGQAPAGANPHRQILAGVLNELVRMHRACPAAGPSDQSPSTDWCKSNRWERCTDLKRTAGTDRYNGLDFLSMEVLMRLAGAGDRI